MKNEAIVTVFLLLMHIYAAAGMLFYKLCTETWLHRPESEDDSHLEVTQRGELSILSGGWWN